MPEQRTEEVRKLEDSISKILKIINRSVERILRIHFMGELGDSDVEKANLLLRVVNEILNTFDLNQLELAMQEYKARRDSAQNLVDKYEHFIQLTGNCDKISDCLPKGA